MRWSWLEITHSADHRGGGAVTTLRSSPKNMTVLPQMTVVVPWYQMNTRYIYNAIYIARKLSVRERKNEGKQ